jgi:uncharacterized membrane protein
MESRAKLFGHPIHQMLIVFPLGLLAMGLLFDIIALFKDNGDDLHRAANYMIGAGIISGLVAAVFGLFDWTGIPSGTRAKQIGLLHGGGNVVIVVLFIIAWWLRRDAPQSPSNTAIVLEIIGGGLALVTGWLGGELVDRLGVGVYPGANLDAPSSLSNRTALDRPAPSR